MKENENSDIRRSAAEGASGSDAAAAAKAVKPAARRPAAAKAEAPAAANAPVLGRIDTMIDILEKLPMNVMIADAEENIVFVNRLALEVLTSLESELAKYLPGFRANQVVGGSIHRYHRDPGAIRKILHAMAPGDVRHGKITPGRFIFEHQTRLLTDEAGNRLGYIVQWQDVTEQRSREEEAARLHRAIDDAQTAMMMIDRNLAITYVNKATRTLLSRNEPILRSLYPSFSVERLIGTCIDIFHKHPEHQRRLLADPANLPFTTDILVGPLIFQICVNPIIDLSGSYIGNTLEWNDVTELRARQKEVTRLNAAIDGASTALMLCDDNLNITYVNAAVVRLLKARQKQLQQIFPSFNPDKLIGVNIDTFHKHPEHQRALLRDLSRLPYTTEMRLLDLTFHLSATGIVDSEGRYCGNMVEWKDISEQKDAERQIQSLIEAAGCGELSGRIDTAAYSGFMQSLGNGINDIMQAVEEPVRESIRVAQALADGDLRENMNGSYRGEFAALQEAMNLSFGKLRETLQQISEMAGSVKVGAGEISQGNLDLAQRTEEQAANLEETASSMEEMTATVKQNADNAIVANQMAGAAREQAINGGSVVAQAVDAMKEINRSSKRIEDIISVIDEIAFQTNILALNAAVEAARAGEQGRGFAVVATEVRTLAQRSAAAAKEIKGLIKDSLERVDEGRRLVDASGKALEEIVAGVRKVSDIIAEIAAAGKEQASGIDQVNKAVAQLDEVTQQNAALVEQSSTASQNLSDQAQALEELIGFFSIADEKPAAFTPGRSSTRAAAAMPAAQPAAVRQPRRASRQESGDKWESF